MKSQLEFAKGAFWIAFVKSFSGLMRPKWNCLPLVLCNYSNMTGTVKLFLCKMDRDKVQYNPRRKLWSLKRFVAKLHFPTGLP